MTIHRLSRIGLTVVVLTAWTGAAHAQVVAPRETAQIEFGPLSLYPSLQILDAGVDENIFNETENPKDDFTLTVASRLLAVMRVGLNDLMFSTGSDYVWFKEYASERSSNQSYAMRFNLSASRFKPYIGGEHLRTRARPSAEIDARAQRVVNMAVTGSSFSLTERTALNVSAQWDRSTFDEGEQFRGVDLDRLNSTGRRYTAGARYAVTPFTSLSFNGVYGEEIFPQSHLRDSNSYGIISTVEFAPEAAIRGSLSGGYQLFVPQNSELSENRGVVFEGALNWALPSMTMFDLSLGREVNYSFEDTAPYYLQTGGRLTITQALAGPFSLRGTADRQYLSYRWRLGVTPTIGDEDRVDTVDVLIGGVTVRLGRGFSVLVGVENTRRDSSSDVRQKFNRTRLLSTFTLGSS
jgi:hypothetical protein